MDEMLYLNRMTQAQARGNSPNGGQGQNSAPNGNGGGRGNRANMTATARRALEEADRKLRPEIAGPNGPIS